MIRRLDNLLTKLPAAFFAVAASSAFANCALPAGYNGSIDLNTLEAVAFHNGNREELVLKINYQITGRILPPHFGWVITLPADPDDHAIADRKLFLQVSDWANPLVNPTPRTQGQFFGRSRLKPGASPSEFGRLARVGPYVIHPIRSRGKEAVDQLNQWLRTNGFPVVDPKHMTYYIKNNFTFLCVRIEAMKGEFAVDRSGDLPPLHLSFASDRLYVPMKLSAGRGEFETNLYLLTSDPFDYLKSSKSLKKIDWTARHLKPNIGIKRFQFPYELTRVYRKTSFPDDPQQSWHLNVIRTEQTNHDHNIAKWKEDLFFDLKND